MPVEVKNIHFSILEVKKALAQFSTRRKKYLEYNDIRNVKVVDKPKINISCELYKSSGYENNIISFNQNEIAAALILFCMDYRIPIPKIATKELQALGEELLLVIKLNHGSEELEEEVFEIG